MNPASLRSRTIHKNHLGLVLSGGGARGAYQSGVLRALYEIQHAAGIPFAKIVCGVSAGAINASSLASQMDQLDVGVDKLTRIWKNLHADEVFLTDYLSVGRNAMSLVRGVSLGGLKQSFRPMGFGLLNTSPLRSLLQDNIDFSRIPKMIESKYLDALAISATDYSTAFGVTFMQARSDLKPWATTARFSTAVEIQAEHVMASTAIPLFFPPSEVSGRSYGDGCLRNTAPLSPAVHLGAQKLLVVGVRKAAPLSDFDKPALKTSLGRVLSVLINALFLDSVEVDLERLRIVNETLRHLKARGIPGQHRPISALYLHPSRDLAAIAKSSAETLPRIIKFLFKGLGSPEESSELLSYLLFEPSYCATVQELGYEDTLQRRDEILQFLQVPLEQ